MIRVRTEQKRRRLHEMGADNEGGHGGGKRGMVKRQSEKEKDTAGGNARDFQKGV